MESLSWWLCVSCKLFQFSCACVCTCEYVCWVSVCWDKSFSLLGWMLTNVRINHYQKVCVLLNWTVLHPFVSLVEMRLGLCCSHIWLLTVVWASCWCLSCDWVSGLFVATDTLASLYSWSWMDTLSWKFLAGRVASEHHLVDPVSVASWWVLFRVDHPLLH